MNVSDCVHGSTCVFMQEHGTTAALIAAVVSIVGLAVKCIYDWRTREDNQKFLTREQDARQAFERQQQARDQAFQAAIVSATEETETRIKMHMEEFISHKKYQDSRRDSRIAAARLANTVLGKTYEDIEGLVGRSSGYDEMSMVTETAKFLDQLSKFKDVVGRQAIDLPRPFRQAGREISELTTKILLTLSPDQDRRCHELHFLEELIAKLHAMTLDFERHFLEFQNNPDRFPPESDVPPPV